MMKAELVKRGQIPEKNFFFFEVGNGLNGGT